MKKGYYYFGESGSLCRQLSVFGVLCLIISCVLFFLGGKVVLTMPDSTGKETYAIWCVFFLLLSIVSFLLILCINKICRDVATLIKEIEAK